MPAGFLQNHFEDEAVTDTIRAQSSESDEAERTSLIEEAQTLLADDISTLPLLQGEQIAVTGPDIDGVQLDASFKFRYAPLVRG